MKIQHIAFALGFLITTISCQENKIPYLKLKDANVYFDNQANRFIPNVYESAKKFKVPIILAGIPGSHPVSVTVTTDTAGHLNPAVEGVDYTLPNKTIEFKNGYGTQYIELGLIDNDIRQESRTFDLVIESTTPELKPNPSNRITITIMDDEHPLLYLCGTYEVSAIDIVYTGKPIEFDVIVSPDPKDDNAVYIENIPLFAIPGTLPKLKLVVDISSQKCHIPGKQMVGNFTYQGESGNVTAYHFFGYTNPDDGKEYLDIDDDAIPGNILNGGKTFRLTEWMGAMATSGKFDGNIFFVYDNFTMNRTSDSQSMTNDPISASIQNIPLRKLR